MHEHSAFLTQVSNFRMQAGKKVRRKQWRTVICAYSMTILLACIYTSRWPTHGQTVQLTKRKSHHHSSQQLNHIDSLVQDVLLPWNARGVYRKDVTAAFDVNLKQDAACFIVQFISGELYTVGSPDQRTYRDGGWNPGQLFRTRRQNILKLIQRALLHGRMPNFEATFCLHDCVVSQRRDTKHSMFGTQYKFIADPIPAFTVVSCIDSANIPFPTWDYATGYFDDWDARVQELTEQAESQTWSSRKPQAVFRGGQRSCMLYPNPGVRKHGKPGYRVRSGDSENAKKCGRNALMYQALTSSRFDLFNVSLTDGVDWRSFNHQLLIEPANPVFLSKAQQEEFKYQIIAEGEWQWANRLRDALFMGNALIIQDFQCIEFYGMRLEPWVHYIPVDYWFKNLTHAVIWAENNPDAVMKMNKAKMSYAKQYLSTHRVEEYVYKLLSGYADLISEDITLRPDATRVDTSGPLENDPIV